MNIRAEEELAVLERQWAWSGDSRRGLSYFLLSVLSSKWVFIPYNFTWRRSESGLERLKAGFQYQSMPRKLRRSISCQEEPAPGNAAGSRHHSWIWMTVLLKLSPAFLLEKTVPKEAQFYIPHELTKAAKENIWCTNQKLMRKYLGVFPSNMWRGMEGRLRG